MGKNKNQLLPWILIVEDDRDLSDMISSTFKNEGFRYVTCASQDEALAAIEKRTFDMILTDIHLLQGTGSDLIRIIRERKNPNQKTPIVVMSGHLDETLIDNVRPWVSDMLVKPFNQSELLNRVSMALSKAA